MAEKKPRTEARFTEEDFAELADLQAAAVAGTLKLRDLTPDEEELHRSIGLPGRPRVGEGSDRILVTVERRLLRELDALVDEAGEPRAQVIAFAIKQLLAEKRKTLELLKCYSAERAARRRTKKTRGKPKTVAGKSAKKAAAIKKR